MKKLLALLLAGLMVFTLCACGGNEADEEEAKSVTLPFEDHIGLYFSSGAGGWGTEIILYADGTFSGDFHDSDMGVTGDEYPNGTQYVCSFWGEFGNIEKIDDTTYSMTLLQLSQDAEEGEEWIEDGIKYIQSYPYGLDGGTSFMFYTPEREKEGLSEDFLMWWPDRFSDVETTTLNYYCIHNLSQDYGAFGN